MIKSHLLEAGTIINSKYKIDVFIGEGAFGEVYRVKHVVLDETQVMKVLKNKSTQNNLDEIIEEARILIKLTHPNIVRVFDVDSFKKEDKEYYFITMEFVSGESLNQLLKRKISLDPPVAVSLIVDILKGLDKVHQSRIIHRDINPDNIFLSYDNVMRPTAKLGDFGIARVQDENTNLSGAAGRFIFFAKECFMNVYLPSSDVFSAGIVLYKMITGKHPWDYEFEKYDLTKQENIQSMVFKARVKTFLPASFFNNYISDNLDKIITKLLETDMEKRYRTAGECLGDLGEMEQTENLTESYWSEQELYSS